MVYSLVFSDTTHSLEFPRHRSFFLIVYYMKHLQYTNIELFYQLCSLFLDYFEILGGDICKAILLDVLYHFTMSKILNELFFQNLEGFK